MKVGEEDQSLSKKLVFLRKRLFHFDDHLSTRPDLACRLDYRPTRGHIFVIKYARSLTRASLDNRRMASLSQCPYTGWYQAHAIFIVFDFFW